MDRREFAGLVAAGAVASGALGAAGSAVAADRSKQQQKARKQFRGFENSVRPAFTPDFQDLDEEGIRHDVRQSIAHGVFSIFLAPFGLNEEEVTRFFSIVVDEADGEVLVSTPAFGGDEAAQIRRAKLAQKAGLNHLLVHPYPAFRPQTEDELYDYYRRVLDATDLEAVLWATGGVQMTQLHQSNVVIDVLDRLADVDNVVGLKLMATLEPAVVFECLERLQDRLMVNCVDLSMMPLLVANYGVQWSGAWTIEALQSVDKPYVVDYLDLLLAGRYHDAMEVYWTMKPAIDYLMGLMKPILPKGIHPAVHLKYYQWCVGGNGGLPRVPDDPGEREFPLTPEQREQIKAAYRAIGIEPQGPEESFITGRAAYARGVRAADVAPSPMYVA